MSLTNYAKEIAKNIDGAKANTVEKANGVILHAVSVPTSGNVFANIYIDKMYESGLSIEEATANVIEIRNNQIPDRSFDLDWITKWESVKGKLVARLYNKKTTAFIKRSASEYGFDDLIIVPYINVGNDGYVKVTEQLFDSWNVSEQEVLETAELNSRNDAVMQSMCEVLGLPEFMFPPMFVLSNKDKCCGAYAIIALMDIVKEKFNGKFTVLPSSIHEVIVVGETDNNPDLTDLVQCVNSEQVDLEEQLSDHAYTFVA